MSSPSLLLSGLVAAPCTPFRLDGTLNVSMIAQLCDHLVANGVSAAFICGTAGEGMSLTDNERKQVGEASVQAAQGSRARD